MPKKISMTLVIAQADSVLSTDFMQITECPVVGMAQKDAPPEWGICGGTQEICAIPSTEFPCIFKVEPATVWLGGFTVCPSDLGPHFLLRTHTFFPSHLPGSIWIRKADKVMHDLCQPIKPNNHVIGLGFLGGFQLHKPLQATGKAKIKKEMVNHTVLFLKY